MALPGSSPANSQSADNGWCRGWVHCGRSASWRSPPAPGPPGTGRKSPGQPGRFRDLPASRRFYLQHSHRRAGCSGVSRRFPLPRKLPGFFASVAGIPLIEQVAQRGKIIFPLFAVHAIVHRNEMDVVLQEKNLGVHPHLKVVPPKPRHILYNDAPDLTGLYIRDHLLEP